MSETVASSGNQSQVRLFSKGADELPQDRLSPSAKPRPMHQLKNHVAALRKSVRDLRQHWAEFAARSLDWRDTFRSQGAEIPQAFFDGYRQLLQQKDAIGQRLAEVISELPECDWNPPQTASTLEEYERRLDELQILADGWNREWEQHRERLLQMLEFATLLESTDGNAGSAVCKQLRSYINPLKADFRAGAIEAEQARTEQAAAVEAVHQLMLLVLDAGVQAGSEVPVDMRLNAEECQTAFDIASEYLGRRIALEAVRGRLRPAANDFDRLYRVATLQDDLNVKTEVVGRPTSNQIEELLNHFGAIPGAAAPSEKAAQKESSESSVRTPVQFEHAVVADSDLAAAAARLRHQADEMWLNPPPAAIQHPGLRQKQVQAEGYRNLASAIELALEIIQARGEDRERYRPELEKTLMMFAEAQNAVRIEQESRTPVAPAVGEQTIAFYWLRSITAEDREQIPISRYMKRSDRADPGNFADLGARLLKLRERWQNDVVAESTLRSIRKQAGKIERILQEAGIPDRSLWQKLARRVCEYLDCGRHASDAELRELLLPIVDEIPEPEECAGRNAEPDPLSSEQLEDVLEQIQRYLALAAAKGTADSHSAPATVLDPETVEAASLLKGMKLTIVGGVPKPHAATRLQRDLALRDVEWLGAQKKDRASNFDGQIGDADLVILLTGLMGHLHNDIRELCSRRGIVCMQMKQHLGYGVNQIAHAIMNQCSDALARRRAGK